MITLIAFRCEIGTIYVNPEHVVCIQASGLKSTGIWFVDGEKCEVFEGLEVVARRLRGNK